MVRLTRCLMLVGIASAAVLSTGKRRSLGRASLIDATIDSLSLDLANGDVTSVDLVNAYLARIAEVNGTLHVVTEVNPDALAIAAQLDLDRASGCIKGPLHGIPILIKNNIATNDSMNNTAGSWALIGAKVPTDSTIAQKLRAAGAVILGKTNLSQWANFRSLNTSNGWSAYGGQVYAAYYPHQDPSGSSSGSGVASSPSSQNNLVGIKPTVGLTSRHLVIPISEHQDTVGPMTRTVKDAAYILQAIAGIDPLDNYTLANPNATLPDYVAACKLSGLEGMRIGIPRNAIELRSRNTTFPITDAFAAALTVLTDAGAILVDNTNFTAAADLQNSTLETRILEADLVVNLKNYLDLLTYNPNNITSLADLTAYTKTFPLEDYPERDTGLWDEALQSYNNTAPEFWTVYQENLYFNEDGGVLGALATYGLDAVVLPAPFAPNYAAAAGLPIVTVPLGAYPNDTAVVTNSWGLVQRAPNIPFGFAFLGPKWSEEKLIGMAYAFEQRTKIRDTIQPYILPTTELAS